MNQDVLDKLKGKKNLTLDQLEDWKFISTGCHALNRIISGDYAAGLPIGGIVQLQGDSSTGKTLFPTTILQAAQRAGCYAKLDDTENTYSREFGRKLGINPDTLLYTNSRCLEDAFESIKKTIEDIRELDKETPIIQVIDSVSVLPTREEMNRDNIGDISPTDGARRAIVFGSLLRKINHDLKKNKATIVVINQIRTKIGVMYGDPNTTASGGRALEFYLAVDLKTVSNKTSDVIKDANKKPIGIVGKIRAKKNKVGLPFQECEFRVLFDKGLDPYFGLAPMLVEDGYINKSDAGRLSIGDTKFKKDDFTEILLDFSNKDTAIIREMLGVKEELLNG